MAVFKTIYVKKFFYTACLVNASRQQIKALIDTLHLITNNKIIA